MPQPLIQNRFATEDSAPVKQEAKSKNANFSSPSKKPKLILKMKPKEEAAEPSFSQPPRQDAPVSSQKRKLDELATQEFSQPKKRKFFAEDNFDDGFM